MCDWLIEPRHSAVCRRLESHIGARICAGASATLRRAAEVLDLYFEGIPDAMTSVALLTCGTPFQLDILDGLRSIPYGHTATYSEIARRAGHPAAIRAAANAIASNPLSVFIPCHRVIGADGSPGGYAGGATAKRILLELERGDSPLTTDWG